MATVTVLGASGTITVPFKSASNALLAQQLASQISAAITGGTLYASPYNAIPLPGLPTVPGGASVGQQVIGDNSPIVPPSTNIANPSGYPAIIVNSLVPVTLTGAAFQGPYSIIGGEGGLTFFGEGSSLGGSIFLGGGPNTITGSATGTNLPDSTNGGLVGNWTIGTGGTDSGDSDVLRLASGSDTVTLGSNDTISTGGANVLMGGGDSPSTVFLGSGNVTYFGGTGSGDIVLGTGVATGNDVLVLGSGGNGTVVAGSGNTTLIGGGNGDIMFGDQGAVQQQFYASGNETMLGGGASSDTFFGFNGADSTGNVWMTAANGTGNNQFWAGAGSDTIWTGMGSDTVFVFAQHTTNTTTPANDIIFGWNANSTLFAYGYTSQSFSSSALGTTLNLSDGTTVTFAGITDPNSIKVI